MRKSLVIILSAIFLGREEGCCEEGKGWGGGGSCGGGSGWWRGRGRGEGRVRGVRRRVRGWIGGTRRKIKTEKKYKTINQKKEKPPIIW